MAHRIREAMKPATSLRRWVAKARSSRPTKQRSAASPKTGAFRKKPIKKANRCFRSLSAAAAHAHFMSAKASAVASETLRPFMVNERLSQIAADDRSGQEFCYASARNLRATTAVDHHRGRICSRRYPHEHGRRVLFDLQARHRRRISPRFRAHLTAILAEFDFRYSHRAKLGVTDGERAALAIAKELRVSASRIGYLTKPRTHKQVAKRFLRWRMRRKQKCSRHVNPKRRHSASVAA